MNFRHVSEKIFDGVVSAKGLDPKTMPKSLIGGRINFVRTSSGYYTGHRPPVGVGIKVFTDGKFTSVVLKKPLEKKLTWEYDEEWFSRESEKLDVEGVDAKSFLGSIMRDYLDSRIAHKVDLKAALDKIDVDSIRKATLKGAGVGISNLNKLFDTIKK